MGRGPASIIASQRPLPPGEVVGALHDMFEPDQEGVGAWARAAFIAGGSPLTNPHHEHLQHATIGWLWASSASGARGRRIIGESHMPKGGTRWSQQRSMFQLEQWFGHCPDFIVTLDAKWCAEANDASFCALVEHELYHCAQDRDVYGTPKFSKATGKPIFAMRGHDVEEFVGVVERYGTVAPDVAALVEAAKRGPILQDGAIAAACGTCMGRAA